jgi:hypothetical protein
VEIDCSKAFKATDTMLKMLESHLSLTATTKTWVQSGNFFTFSLTGSTVNDNIKQNIAITESKSVQTALVKILSGCDIPRDRQLHEVWELVKALWGAHEGRFRSLSFLTVTNNFQREEKNITMEKIIGTSKSANGFERRLDTLLIKSYRPLNNFRLTTKKRMPRKYLLYVSILDNLLMLVVSLWQMHPRSGGRGNEQW